MNISLILEELYERRRCIEVAIEALEWAERPGRRGARPPWLRAGEGSAGDEHREERA